MCNSSPPTPVITAENVSQALQHIYHKSGYNYTKRRSVIMMAEIMAGPGIAVALGIFLDHAYDSLSLILR